MKSSFLFRCARYCLSILLLFLSSGCSISMYKNRSECPLQSTISCQPVSKINELINENKLEDFTRQQSCKGDACGVDRKLSVEKQVINPNYGLAIWYVLVIDGFVAFS